MRELPKAEFWDMKRARVPETEIAILSGLDAAQARDFAQKRRQTVHTLPYMISRSTSSRRSGNPRKGAARWSRLSGPDHAPRQGTRRSLQPLQFRAFFPRKPPLLPPQRLH